MKKELLHWFEYQRDVASGIILYRKYGRNKSYARALNTTISKKEKLNILVEEFRTLADLSFVELNTLLNKPVKSSPKKEMHANIKEPIQKESKSTIKIKDIPKQKLREEFPFLSDPNCPMELKALVSDKITAYHTYVERHKHLFTASSEQEQFEAVRDVVENYILNKELYAELDYYKKHNKILGEYKFFEKLKREEALRSLKTEELVVMKDNFSKYILRDNKKLAVLKDESRRKTITDRIETREWEISTINIILADRK